MQQGEMKHIGNREYTPIQATIAAPPLLTKASVSDEELLAIHGRTFHFAARFFPLECRRSVVTFYAFFRTLDDLVDEPTVGWKAEDVRLELQAWQDWFLAGRSFPAPRESLGSRLDAVLRKQHIPDTIFLDFLAGLASDLEPCEMQTFDEMHRYCHRVAGTVGLAMVHLLGVHSDQALAAAESLGIAMQLTNILRDVGSDLAANRLYIPQDELARFDCSRAHLLHLYQQRRGPDDRFRALMRYQVERAHRYYAQGLAGIWLLPSNCRLPVLLAGRLYRRILEVIASKDYDVLRSRAATSFVEKVSEAALAFMLDRLWRQGEAHHLTPGMEVLFEEVESISQD